MSKSISSCIGFFFLFLSLPIAANPNLIWNLGSRPDLTAEVKNLLSSIDREKKTAGVRQLLLRVDINIGDEEVLKNVSKVWYFSDLAALQEYGTDVIRFNELTETVRVNEIVVIKPNGTLTHFNPKNVQLIDSDRFDVFSNEKRIVLPFPGIEVGGVALINYDIIVKKSLAETAWSDVFYPQNLFPRDNLEINIKWKKNNQIYWSATNGAVSCVKKESSLSCSGNSIKAVQTDNAVWWNDILSQLIVSESADWNQVINNAFSAFSKASIKMEGIDSVLNKISQQASTLEDKIEGIHKFVARDIRYVSISKNGHTITPHSIADTIKNRYGDCKDKSAVLVELLNRVGLKAFPVLIASDRTNPEILQTPAMSYFDHMVVCFDLHGDKKCLDATDQYTNWATTSSWIQGKVSLDLKLNSEPANISNSNFRWNIKVYTQLVLTGDGGAKEKQKRVYLSEYAGSLKGIVARKSEQDIRRWALENYQNVVSKEVEPIFEFSDIESLEPQFEIKSVAVYKPFLDTNSDLSYFEYDSWLQEEINASFLKNRVYDAFFPGIQVESEYEIDISSRWKYEGGGANLDLDHKYGSLTRKVNSERGGKLFFSTKLLIPSRVIPVDEVSNFNKFLNLVKRESTIQIYGKQKK